MLSIINRWHGDQNNFNWYLIFGVGKWVDVLNFIDFGARKWAVIDFGVVKWADELTSVNKINFGLV